MTALATQIRAGLDQISKLEPLGLLQKEAGKLRDEAGKLREEAKQRVDRLEAKARERLVQERERFAARRDRLRDQVVSTLHRALDLPTQGDLDQVREKIDRLEVRVGELMLASQPATVSAARADGVPAVAGAQASVPSAEPAARSRRK